MASDDSRDGHSNVGECEEIVERGERKGKVSNYRHLSVANSRSASQTARQTVRQPARQSDRKRLSWGRNKMPA